MKFFALALATTLVTSCGGDVFGSRPVPKNSLIGSEKVQAADSQVDSSASAGIGQKDGSASGGNYDADKAKNGSSGKPASDSMGASEMDAAAKAQADALLARCPALDPVLLDTLIKSGQPFEVECEVEVEVGPDRD